MKKVLLLGLIVLISGCVSFQPVRYTDFLSQEYLDEYQGKAVTAHDDIAGTQNTRVQIIKSYTSTGAPSESFRLSQMEYKNTKTYYITFCLSADSWWFVNKLIIKVGNNEPIVLKSISQNTDVLSGGNISEWVMFAASLEMFQVAATAENIRVRIIGNKHIEDYEITPEDQVRIKRLLAAI